MPASPTPEIAEVAAGGKKLTAWGSNFGREAHVIVNGVDITNLPGITIVKAKDGVVKLSAQSISIYGFHPGVNTIQVMTKDTLIVPDAFSFSL